MFTSKRISLLTILALLIPTSAGIAGFGSSAANAATTLEVFTINGEDVSGLENNSTVTLDTYSTSVAVVATATDVSATTVITLNGTVDGTAVNEGNNTLVVAVTDSEATSTTTLTLVVPQGDRTSATISLNSLTLGNGDVTSVAYGTTSLPISVTLDDANASVRVNDVLLTKSGAVATGTVEGLETGENTVRVLVTAADGTNVDESLITVNVAQNNNAEATLVVNGQNADNGDVVVLDPLTTDADIEVNTVDPNATYEISGGSSLVTNADNLVVITVTAEDGVTVATYNLTLQVAKNDNADLDLLIINGAPVSDGDTVELAYQTTSVTFEVYPSDIDATYVVTGGTGLLQGPNDLIVRITAANGETVGQYVVTLNVADPDVTLSNFKFNGSNVAVDTVVSTYAQSNFLTLATTDSRATVAVVLPAVAEGEENPYLYNAATGELSLPLGETEITVTVTGHDQATTADYVFTVLKAGIRVDFEGNSSGAPIAVTGGQIIDVPAGTGEVSLEVLAPADSNVDIEGDQDLVTGLNDVYVVITDQDLRVITTVFQVRVLPADGSLTAFTVNDEDVILTGNNGVATLEAGTTSVDVVIEAVDPGATYVVTGNTGLVLGNNLMTVVLTTGDGTQVTYTVTLTVLASDIAEFDAITINGLLVEGEDLIEVDAGVIDVQVDTADSNATVTVTPAVTTVIEPAAEVGGESTIVRLDGTVSNVGGIINASGYVTLNVVVTAQNGLVTETAQVNLLASTDLGVFNGSSVTDDELRVGTYAKIDSIITRNQFETGAGLKYKWTVDGVAVPNATTTRFLLTPEHVEAEVRPVVTSLIGGRTKTVIGKKLDVALGLIKKAPTPLVQGKSALGSTLKAVSKAWTKDVELSYAWYVNYDPAEENTPVGTDETFVLGSDVAKDDVITLGVSGSLEGYATLEKLSAPMTVTRGTIKFTTRPSFEADVTFVTGATVVVAPGESTNADAEFVYEWTYSGQATVLGTDAEYELTPADFNKKLTVKVTAAADDYDSATFTLKTPTIKAGTLEEVEAPTITRGALSLTAVGGFSGDVTATSVQYVWYRNGRIITDAKASTYTLRTKDVLGTVFSVRVIGKYLGYKATSAISDPEEPFVLAPFVEEPVVVVPEAPVVPAP